MTDPAHRPEKRNLGRGLAALFGEEQTRADAAELETVRGVRRMALSQIRPGRMQPRRRFPEEAQKALVDSIREKGVLMPLLVRRVPGAAEEYEIVAGERRWAAAQTAQVHDVPVVVRELSDQEALEIGLIENIQRQDLSPLEEASGYYRLMNEFDHTQETLAKVVGKSRSHVANMLRLLHLPDEVKMLVDDGSLSMGHARAILNAENPGAVAREVLDKELSVRDTEKLVARLREGPARARAQRLAPRPAPKDADTRALERDLSLLLGLKVEIALAGEAGAITIRFATLEQLDDVLHRLKRDPQGRAE